MESQLENSYLEKTQQVQQQHSREDSASPTAALESIMQTAVIAAHEEGDVLMCNIPNAFIQALMPKMTDGNERVMMKIIGVLVNMLVKVNHELYGPYVVYETGKYFTHK
jgi:hypothetical protein